MQKSILYLIPTGDKTYESNFLTNHGRKLYIHFILSDKQITVLDCHYTDRPKKNGLYPIPLKLKTTKFQLDNLLQVIEDELDKHFYGVQFMDDQQQSAVIMQSDFAQYNKLKFLIMVKDGAYLRTRLKNRVHRTIYLELQSVNDNLVISDCRYMDRNYMRKNVKVSPHGLNTIFLNNNIESILELVNNELNCDFTHLITTQNTIDFYSSSAPICGNI